MSADVAHSFFSGLANLAIWFVALPGHPPFCTRLVYLCASFLDSHRLIVSQVSAVCCPALHVSILGLLRPFCGFRCGFPLFPLDYLLFNRLLASHPVSFFPLFWITFLHGICIISKLWACLSVGLLFALCLLCKLFTVSFFCYLLPV